MSSWAVLLAWQGFRWNAGAMRLELRTAEAPHRSVVCAGAGWGEYVRTGRRAALAWRAGSITVASLVLALPPGGKAGKVRVEARGVKAAATVRGGRIEIAFGEPLRLEAGAGVAVAI